MKRGNMTVYEDTGCRLSPKCTECLIPLERCPANEPDNHHPQGELSGKARKRLQELRIGVGGDILDEGSPMNLRWRKYWATQ